MMAERNRSPRGKLQRNIAPASVETVVETCAEYLLVAAEGEVDILFLKEALNTEDHAPQQVIRGCQRWTWIGGGGEGATQVKAG